MKVWLVLAMAGLYQTALADTALLMPADIPSLATEERNLWFETRDTVKSLERSGAHLGDIKVQSYLQGIVDRLYPEWKGHLTVQVIKDADYNAFALPDGHIYINAGLLGRLENEAQVAIVLAHEGAHVLLRHTFKQRASVTSSIVFSQVVGMINPNVGRLVTIGLEASLYGYSRDAEREADQIGFTRFKQAGYSLPQAVRTFEILLEEVKVLKVPQPVFYASHPRLEERIENFRTMIKSGGSDGQATGEAAFHENVGQLREQSLQMALESGRYDVVLASLEEGKNLTAYPSHIAYYRGEAFRLRRQKDDEGKALKAYQQAYAAAPTFPYISRGMGIVSLRQGNKVDAAKWLQNYLALDPTAKDRPFIEEMLDIAKDESK